MLITPPTVHINLELLLRAGVLPIKTVGEPGVHGAVIAGTQGCDTPADAAVFNWHVPNGLILTVGLLSIIVAADWFEIITLLAGDTSSVPGADPETHIIDAPLHTHIPIGDSLSNY